MVDFLIVGAGLYGSVFAHEAAKAGKSCLVLEKRGHVGGNCFTEDWKGIPVHRYGPHIFHTADRAIWDYVSGFAELRPFVNSPVANYRGRIYNLPFNMNTFYQLWGARTPAEAEEALARRRVNLGREPENLEELALASVGGELYETLIRGYTEKQWGRPCRELPAFILGRVPVRFTYDNNYYRDPYQGVPLGGYTRLIENLLAGCEVRLHTDFLDDPGAYRRMAGKILYTGTIDGYFGYRFGPLEYRSLRFEHEMLEIENEQGVAVMNYTDAQIPYTRVIEHKHFVQGTQPYTVITREYPQPWQPGTEAYYPVNDAKNQALYARYAALAAEEPQVVFGGRLGLYRYLDMQDAVALALECARREL